MDADGVAALRCLPDAVWRKVAVHGEFPPQWEIG